LFSKLREIAIAILGTISHKFRWVLLYNNRKLITRAIAANSKIHNLRKKIQRMNVIGGHVTFSKKRPLNLTLQEAEKFNVRYFERSEYLKNETSRYL